MVYPRVCGVDPGDAAADIRDLGLSPRVRGRFEPTETEADVFRFIPACAG